MQQPLPEKNTLSAAVAARFCQGLGPYLASPVSADTTEQRVVRQFVEALLFEQIVSYEQVARDQNHHEFRRFEAIYNRVFTFSLSGILYRCVATCRVFDRVRIAQGSVACRYGNEFREARLVDVVQALDVDPAAKERLMGELSQTIALCRWNAENLSHHLSPRRNLSFPELESAITEGHLYHPSFKARTGFSLDDHQKYGPEQGRQFQFVWLAVRTEQLNRALPGAENAFWLEELGEETYALLTARLQQAGANWPEFALLPVHPWQFDSIQERGLRQAMTMGDIISLGAAGDFYQATQSLRTLVNVTDPAKANVKIPLNLVSTSSHRNLQKHFVCTAPTISDWLQTIVAKDDYLQRENKLLLLSEYAGLLYEPEETDWATEIEGLLGAIFRESVLGKLVGSEQAVPFTAMMLVESDGHPFIAGWLEQYGVEVWVDRLIEVMLIPIWHMLVQHGIAFEAHAQNLVLIHRDGWPERIVLRDFHEDMEYVQAFLSDPQNPPALEEVDPYFANIALDDGFSMESIDALRELFMDTVYVFNLADLSFLIERFTAYPEASFWQRVRRQLEMYRESGVTDPERIDQIGADQPEIIVESLLKKKIMDGGVLDYYEHDVANALHMPISGPESH